MWVDAPPVLTVICLSFPVVGLISYDITAVKANRYQRWAIVDGQIIYTSPCCGLGESFELPAESIVEVFRESDNDFATIHTQNGKTFDFHVGHSFGAEFLCVIQEVIGSRRGLQLTRSTRN